MANQTKAGSETGTGSAASPCTPFSVNLAVLSPDDQTQVSFGISRHCPPSGTLYIIIFVLRTNESGTFQDRITLMRKPWSIADSR